MGTYILYRYNDMIGILVSGPGKVDLLTNYVLSFLLQHMNLIAANNILVFTSIILSLYFTHLLFRNLMHGNNAVSVLATLFGTFNVYFMMRIFSMTHALYFTFVFPLTVYLLNKKINPLFIGLYLFLVFNISNYYGYFCSVLTVLWILMLSEPLKNRLLFLLISLSVLIFLIGLFFLPTVISNNPILSRHISVTASSVIYKRPLEDWFNFSFRPWYFVVPPKTSLIFGSLSKSFYMNLAATGWYLGNSYTEDEMAGCYFGWDLILGTFAVFVILFWKNAGQKFTHIMANRSLLIRLFIICFILVLISLPPYISFGSIKFYFPSYVLYFFVPMFRTLVRWAGLIQLLIVIVNSFLLMDILKLITSRVYKSLLILTLFIVHFALIGVQIPLIDLKNPPREIIFLKDVSPHAYNFAVYPIGDYYSVFWTQYHHKNLINPKDYINSVTGFNSYEFSRKLLTIEGKEYLMSKEVSYIVYYQDKDKGYARDTIFGLYGVPIYSTQNIYIFAVK